MPWRKQGLIFAPSGREWWMRTHAALPVPLLVDGGVCRVYISGRNEDNQAQIGFFEFDISDSARVLRVSADPVVCLGPLGAHDESGVTSSCLVSVDGALYLYYTGWSLGKTVPFTFHIGVAISKDGGVSFQKPSEGPILGRSRFDPYLVASPSVLCEGSLWRMWYVSGLRWETTDVGPKHYYHIRYAESDDGITWVPTGKVCVDFSGKDEFAFGRPVVIKAAGGGYRMWYCVRGAAYRIGYAESADGVSWIRRDDQAGIAASSEGWDSEMLAYPYVFEHGGAAYMLYNGNDYGRTGVGLAVLNGP